MNVSGCIELPSRTSLPPKYKTQQRTSTPMNSDKGEARSFLNIILFLRCVSVSLLVKNFVRCSFSALNALITRNPPSVSSSIDISVPISSCDCVDCFRSERLTLPMINPVNGSKINHIKGITGDQPCGCSNRITPSLQGTPGVF